MSNKESTWEPSYPQTLHPDVIGECRRTWMAGRPYTNVQVLRKGVDASDMPCCGATGFPGPCSKKVEACQYNTAFGDQLTYCEEHAVIQQEWDVVHYDSKGTPKRPKWTEEDERLNQKLRSKKEKKEREEDIE